MIIIDTQDRKAREQLSKKAAKHFEKFTEAQVYVNGGIESGSLIALKWGEADGEKDSVVVLRISSDDVELYRGLVKSE